MLIGKGIRRRVLPDSRIPGNWQSFLRLDKNKQELFEFLSNEAINISTEKVIVSTIGEVAVTNGSSDLSFMSPSNHEEADTRMLLHAMDASQKGATLVLIRTVDTDVVVIAIAMFSSLDLFQLWLSFGVGKHQRMLSIHSLFNALGESKCKCLPFFHAFTGCDQVSFFAGRGKKVAWTIWNQHEEVTSSFLALSNCPSSSECDVALPSIERFVSLLYDRTSTETSVNKCRKVLFASKGRSLEGIPPTSDALLQHTKRAIYQAGYCWSQSLVAQQNLPNPNEWGWKSEEDESFTISWITIPQASAICYELIRCGCKKEKGCKGRCKCRKATLKCTALCKCSGDCDDGL